MSLRAAGHDIDFVGSQTRNHWGAPLNSDFDLDHEGHWGWRADEILAELDGWLKKNTPDVVLLHIGTNDLGHGEDIPAIAEEIGQIIGRLRQHNGSVTILLAKIIPIAHPLGAARIRKLNAALEELAETFTADDSRIVAVDQMTVSTRRRTRTTAFIRMRPAMRRWPANGWMRCPASSSVASDKSVESTHKCLSFRACRGISASRYG